MGVTHIKGQQVLDGTINTNDLADGAVTHAKLNADVPNTTEGMHLDTSGLGVTLYSPTTKASGLVFDASNGGLRIYLQDTSRGLFLSSTTGLQVQCLSTGGLTLAAGGVQIKLDGTSLSTSANGAKVALLAGGGITTGTGGLRLPLTAKGQLLTHNGTDHIVLAAGADGTLLRRYDTAASGLSWDKVYLADLGVFSGKGQLLTNNGAINTTLAPGSDGQVLESRASAAAGIAWADRTRVLDAAATAYGPITAVSTYTDFGWNGNSIPSAWWAIGRAVRITAWGVYSCPAAANQFMFVQFRIGSYAAGLGGGVLLPASGATNFPWRASFIAVCRSVGTSGEINAAVDADAFAGGRQLGAVAITGFDTTSGWVPTVWGYLAQASCSMTMTGALIELLS